MFTDFGETYKDYATRVPIVNAASTKRRRGRMRAGEGFNMTCCMPSPPFPRSFRERAPCRFVSNTCFRTHLVSSQTVKNRPRYKASTCSTYGAAVRQYVVWKHVIMTAYSEFKYLKTLRYVFFQFVLVRYRALQRNGGAGTTSGSSRRAGYTSVFDYVIRGSVPRLPTVGRDRRWPVAGTLSVGPQF